MRASSMEPPPTHPGSWSLGFITLPPAVSPLSSPPPLPSDFETLPVLSGSYHPSLFLYTYELFRSGPKLQLVGVVLWGQGALAASRAMRKFLPGLAELMSGLSLHYSHSADLSLSHSRPSPRQLLRVLGSLWSLTVFYLYHCYKY